MSGYTYVMPNPRRNVHLKPNIPQPQDHAGPAPATTDRLTCMLRCMHCALHFAQHRTRRAAVFAVAAPSAPPPC
eukprot:6191471-Pleurochrysis_carterae.AAC.2